MGTGGIFGFVSSKFCRILMMEALEITNRQGTDDNKACWVCGITPSPQYWTTETQRNKSLTMNRSNPLTFTFLLTHYFGLAKNLVQFFSITFWPTQYYSLGIPSWIRTSHSSLIEVQIDRSTTRSCDLEVLEEIWKMHQRDVMKSPCREAGREGGCSFI